jgi:SAM-dependent methyltransferase
VARLKARLPSGDSDVAGDPVSAMIPPFRIASYVGGTAAQFRDVGRMMLNGFCEYADLRPDERVLEVGCGIGRIAVALTQYLNAGTYVGFDIVPHGIAWCRKKITPRYPNFTFFVADVYNGLYHPKGKFKASAYRFPFDDASFSFVYLTSVFTHMLPADMEQYVREMARVLDAGGRCFCTAYVMSPQARSHLVDGTSLRKFRDSGRGYWTDQPGTPEGAIAFDEDYLLGVFRREGLNPMRFVPGEWWKDRNAQDILVLSKITR